MKILLTLALTFFTLSVFAHGDEEKKPMDAMDHSKMEGMDHSKMKGMDHDKMKAMMKSCMKDHDMKEMDHDNMTDKDRAEMKAMMKKCMADNGMDHSKMKGMDHSKMKDMDHSKMKDMDHDKMKDMDHDKMKGMDHDKMKGMDHEEGGEHSHGGDHGGGSHANSAGTPVPPTQWVDAVVNVTLLDTMKIEYAEPVNLKAGNVVKFVVTNKGKLRHEFSVSNAEEQIAHVAMMRKMPNMTHDDGTTISLESGATGELYWKFDGESEVVFSCNIPGHSEAGMLTHVTVAGGKAGGKMGGMKGGEHKDDGHSH